MAGGYYKAVCEILSKCGYVYAKNAKGSHEKWVDTSSGKTVVVPRNLKSRHTANAILRSAGYPGRL